MFFLLFQGVASSPSSMSQSAMNTFGTAGGTGSLQRKQSGTTDASGDHDGEEMDGASGGGAVQSFSMLETDLIAENEMMDEEVSILNGAGDGFVGGL
jgi:hypothetical protein